MSKDKKESAPAATVQEKDIMCELPVKNLKAVCEWLNGDDMILPQNEIRKALALLLVSKIKE